MSRNICTRENEIDTPNETLTEVELRRIARAGLIAGEQLKVAKQIVTDAGFANASTVPMFVAAVLQALAINYQQLNGDPVDGHPSAAPTDK